MSPQHNGPAATRCELQSGGRSLCYFHPLAPPNESRRAAVRSSNLHVSFSSAYKRNEVEEMNAAIVDSSRPRMVSRSLRHSRRIDERYLFMYFSFGEEGVLLWSKLCLYLAFNHTEDLMLSRMGRVFKNFLLLQPRCPGDAQVLVDPAFLKLVNLRSTFGDLGGWIWHKTV